MKRKKIMLWGASSRSKVVNNLFFQDNKFINEKNNFSKDQVKVKYIFDPFIEEISFNSSAVFSNKKEDLRKFILGSDYYVVCVGGHHGKLRVQISKLLEENGLDSIKVIHKDASIEKSVILGNGVQINPGVTVNCDCQIGDYCILNTSCSLDHDCKIDNGSHIMGGATIAGNVKIGQFVNIGTNATVLPNLNIGDGAYIGAGAVVLNDVGENEVVVGNPARIKKITKIKNNYEEIKTFFENDPN